MPVVAALEMSIVVVGKKDGVGKLRPQRAQNHQLVINVGAEQTDGANSETILALPTYVVLSHLPRQAPEIIRLIQPFGRFDCDAVLSDLNLLSLLAPIVFGRVARQLGIHSAQIRVTVDQSRPLLWLLNTFG